ERARAVMDPGLAGHRLEYAPVRVKAPSQKQVATRRSAAADDRLDQNDPLNAKPGTVLPRASIIDVTCGVTSGSSRLRVRYAPTSKPTVMPPSPKCAMRSAATFCRLRSIAASRLIAT